MIILVLILIVYLVHATYNLINAYQSIILLDFDKIDCADVAAELIIIITHWPLIFFLNDNIECALGKFSWSSYILHSILKITSKKSKIN